MPPTNTPNTELNSFLKLAEFDHNKIMAENWESAFDGVTPIDQDDGPVPVVKIDYSPEFTKVMGYFRRVLVDGEHSARALSLSAGGSALMARAIRTLRTAGVPP